MSITMATVEHIAQLARLQLSEKEKEEFGKQLGAILEYMDKLNELNVDGVTPTAHAVPLQTAFREDAVKPSLARDALLQNGPALERNHFSIPRVIP